MEVDLLNRSFVSQVAKSKVTYFFTAMVAPAIRSCAAAALLLAALAVQAVLAADTGKNAAGHARPSTSGKGPFGEERPFLETLIPPPYHTHAYHNPSSKQDGEDLSKKLYRGMKWKPLPQQFLSK